MPPAGHVESGQEVSRCCHHRYLSSSFILATKKFPWELLEDRMDFIRSAAGYPGTGQLPTTAFSR